MVVSKAICIKGREDNFEKSAYRTAVKPHELGNGTGNSGVVEGKGAIQHGRDPTRRPTSAVAAARETDAYDEAPMPAAEINGSRSYASPSSRAAAEALWAAMTASATRSPSTAADMMPPA